MHKKIITALSFIAIGVIANAQNGNANASAVWNQNGNAPTSTSSFVGTTNNMDFSIRAGNTELARFLSSGKILLGANAGEIIIGGGGGSGGGAGVFKLINSPVANAMFSFNALDVHIERSLFVSEYVEIMKSIKVPKIEGNLEIKNDLTVNGKLTVGGDATFQNNLFAQKGVMFDNTFGIKYIQGVNGSASSIYYGKGTPTLFSTGCQVSSVGSVLHKLDGFVQVYDGNDPTNTRVLQLAGNQYGCNIESNDALGTNGVPLTLNYFCGGDVNICTNTGQGTGSNGQGGVVNLGWNLNVGAPYPAPNTTAVNIKANAATGLNIMDANNANIFTVSNSGKTSIGPIRISSGDHTDAMLQVGGKIVAKSCYITVQNWADFVFEKNYVLPSLKEVEAFYKANKHLPGVPTEKEVMGKGINVAEMTSTLLQKVEELTIYTVQLQKENEELKKKVEAIENKLDQK
jgi:hypothetical protein